MRLALALLLAAFLALLLPPTARADEGWVIESFDVTYEIDESGVVYVTEDIRVDFGGLEKHGIFRDMPVRYDIIGDDDNDRLISVGNVSVDNGSDPWQFELIESGANLRIKIGHPDVTISGEQRYRISYILTGALNPFLDHDEFFWNVTGNDWPVRIQRAAADVTLPDPAVQRVTCYQGPSGSTDPCNLGFSPDSAHFETFGTLSEGSALTIVLDIEKGAIDVAPPILVPAADTEWEQFVDGAGFTKPVAVAVAVAALAIGMVAVVRLWWEEGRDRWMGDMFYLYEDDPKAVDHTKPLMARETIVVEYTPPEVDKRARRRMRPAEIGVLLDERADTLDVSATIVDLAVRKHIRIKEEESGGFLGLFKKTDYEIELIGEPDELLPYEARLKKALLDGKQTVKMSSLKNKFHKDLDKVKDALYRQAVKDRLFARNPETTRTTYQVAGIILAVAAGFATYFLGRWLGAGIVGVPFVLTGAAVFFAGPAMPRRTGRGRSLYRRTLGFRLFMTRAETERQRFAEQKNIFHEYLPYAIVYGCVDKWAKAFEGLASEPDYYVGTRAFAVGHFVGSVSSFSASVSATMASTPGGSGSSGFGGGGSSGGGGGGGGGGSW